MCARAPGCVCVCTHEHRCVCVPVCVCMCARVQVYQQVGEGASLHEMTMSPHRLEQWGLRCNSCRGRVGGGVTSPQQKPLCEVPQEANPRPHPQVGQRSPSLSQGKRSHHLLSRDHARPPKNRSPEGPSKSLILPSKSPGWE